jgi:hypothetical protein
MCDARSTAQSQWGKKIKAKLYDRQSGGTAEKVLRTLVLNFSHADAAQPSFFLEPKVAERIDETVRLLVDDSNDPPYDLVLPAWLIYDCRFGKPVWLTKNKELRTEGDQFLESANLTKPPTLDRGDQQKQIDELLGEDKA